MPSLRHILREQGADVALVNETHFHPALSASIPGYQVFRLDTTAATPMRGLLVAVRGDLVLQQLPTPDTQSFQALGVEIQVEAKPLRIYAIYNPSNSTLVASEVSQLFASPAATLAAGDWNAPSSLGRSLLKPSGKSAVPSR